MLQQNDATLPVDIIRPPYDSQRSYVSLVFHFSKIEH